LLAYRRLDTGEERAFCRLWSASRAFYLLYRIEIVAVGHVSACMTHWVPEASTAPLWQLEFRGFHPLGLETNNTALKSGFLLKPELLISRNLSSFLRLKLCFIILLTKKTFSEVFKGLDLFLTTRR